MSGALERACAAAGVTLRHDLRPGDIGEIVRIHGDLYAREHGFSIGFEAYVAGTFAGYSWPLSAQERLWMLEKDGQMGGTIAIVRAADGSAQLRWLLLRADLRGRGLGRALVEEALAFCRLAGYSAVFLWTVSTLTTATSVYRRAGFVRTETKTGELWGAVRTEERYDLPRRPTRPRREAAGRRALTPGPAAGSQRARRRTRARPPCRVRLR